MLPSLLPVKGYFLTVYFNTTDLSVRLRSKVKKYKKHRQSRHTQHVRSFLTNQLASELLYAVI